jgi:hypothetical protein
VSEKNQISLPDFSEGLESEYPGFVQHDFVVAKLPESVPSTPKQGVTESAETALPFSMEKGLFESILADYGIS